MRACFPIVSGEGWAFPRIYMSDMAHVLKAYAAPDADVCLWLGHETGPLPKEYEGVSDRVVARPEPRDRSLRRVGDSIAFRLFGLDPRSERALRESQVDVLMFFFPPGRCSLPTVHYVYDYQHVHHPELFAQTELRARDRIFADLARRAARVIVWSKSVMDDFSNQLPHAAQKVRLLPPVARIPQDVVGQDPRETVARYCLPRKYIYVPNQFWRHKGHDVVLEALRILKTRGHRITIVFSGFTHDYRHPSFFSDLVKQVSILGVRDDVAILGQIPRDDVFQLMRCAQCVVNPSRFEGFGMSVEEARSVGKVQILTDIPPLREQNPPGAVYVPAGDPGSLADAMWARWAEDCDGFDRSRESSALQDNRGRLKHYARDIVSLLGDVKRGVGSSSP